MAGYRVVGPAEILPAYLEIMGQFGGRPDKGRKPGNMDYQQLNSFRRSFRSFLRARVHSDGVMTVVVGSLLADYYNGAASWHGRSDYVVSSATAEAGEILLSSIVCKRGKLPAMSLFLEVQPVEDPESQYWVSAWGVGLLEDETPGGRVDVDLNKGSSPDRVQGFRWVAGGRHSSGRWRA